MVRNSRRTRRRSPARPCFICCSAKSPGPWPASSSTGDAGPSARPASGWKWRSDDRSKQIEALTGQGRKAVVGGVVKAPMPGLVVRVEVSAGQSVEVGEGLVGVEAMKKENELRATHASVVEQIHVSAGQRVEKGTPLVTLSPKPTQPSG